MARERARTAAGRAGRRAPAVTGGAADHGDGGAVGPSKAGEGGVGRGGEGGERKRSAGEEYTDVRDAADILPASVGPKRRKGLRYFDRGAFEGDAELLSALDGGGDARELGELAGPMWPGLGDARDGDAGGAEAGAVLLPGGMKLYL
jgi:hypothetical protein